MPSCSALLPVIDPMRLWDSERVLPKQANYNARGFSLLDLLIVLLILGVLAVVVTPQFQAIISEERLNEATGELVSGLQYAGNLAVQYQRPFALRADVSGNSFKVIDYQYRGDPNPHHGSDPPSNAYGVVLNPVDKSWYVKDFDTIYDGVILTSVPAGAETCFYPDGHSSSSDSIFVLSHGGDQRTVTVDGITGWISVN